MIEKKNVNNYNIYNTFKIYIYNICLDKYKIYKYVCIYMYKYIFYKRAYSTDPWLVKSCKYDSTKRTTFGLKRKVHLNTTQVSVMAFKGSAKTLASFFSKISTSVAAALDDILTPTLHEDEEEDECSSSLAATATAVWWSLEKYCDVKLEVINLKISKI